MKRKQIIILLLLGIFYIPYSLNAQVNLSGSFGMKYVKSAFNYKILSYNVTPKIGFEINDKIIIGGLIGYSEISLKYSEYIYYQYSYSEVKIDNTIGIINIGAYSRFNMINSDKMRLLLEPALMAGIDTGLDFMFSFMTVPVVQFRITEKVYFDMTLGLMGVSIVAIPDSRFYEFNFGLNNNDLAISKLELNNKIGTTLTPIQLGFTFAL